MASNFTFLQKEKNFTSFAPLMLQAERAMSIIMLRSDWAYRILFLADRNPLVRQGKNRYTEIFGNTYPLCNLVLRSPSAPLFMP